MTAATGVNWKKFRSIIETEYTDVIVFSGRFSADTGMKEIIISAKKLKENEKPSGRGVFVSLDKQIDTILEGACIGKAARNLPTLSFEDTMQGSTRILVGDDEMGSALDCPLQDGWHTVDAADFTLHQIVQYLRQGKLYLPYMRTPLTIRTTTLSEIADMGKSHLQIRGGKAQPGRTTSYSGPFNLREYRPGCIYPSLWNNHNMVQRQMMVSPDCSLEPRPDCDVEKVEEVWKTRSNIHMNVTTDTTSQALMMSYTKKPVVGGRSWPSVITKRRYIKGLVVWCNSTLGILCRWAISNHQQIGRSTTSHTALRDLLVPAPANLARIGDMFDGFAQKKLDRIMNLWKDSVRIDMDTHMLNRLGVGGVDLDDLRMRLCAEPSMHGRRPITELEICTSRQLTSTFRTDCVCCESGGFSGPDDTRVA